MQGRHCHMELALVWTNICRCLWFWSASQWKPSSDCPLSSNLFLPLLSALLHCQRVVQGAAVEGVKGKRNSQKKVKLRPRRDLSLKALVGTDAVSKVRWAVGCYRLYTSTSTELCSTFIMVVADLCVQPQFPCYTFFPASLHRVK